ncbi:hypothetical protein DY000_02037835 [Brassica cretica]|uniref:Uncharacterized protein n=1 Tax=Brassica cretica TaxID=69181 RepID=A0ABQ7B516_BRACR|nr:hypothetical protein DY000_02037835 [Brassica cretica]
MVRQRLKQVGPNRIIFPSWISMEKKTVGFKAENHHHLAFLRSDLVKMSELATSRMSSSLVGGEVLSREDYDGLIKLQTFSFAPARASDEAINALRRRRSSTG